MAHSEVSDQILFNWVNKKSLLIELWKRDLKVESEVPIQVKYKGELVGDYFADIVVEDRIILELKAIEKLQPVHEAQLLNYLKATGIQVGFLINFTHPKAEIKRMVFNLSEGHGGDLAAAPR